MCGLVLIAAKSGSDPDDALKAMWDHAKACVSDFWPNTKPN
jgi:hypothetical protein